jgi:hypothetical protein
VVDWVKLLDKVDVDEIVTMEAPGSCEMLRETSSTVGYISSGQMGSGDVVHCLSWSSESTGSIEKKAVSVLDTIDSVSNVLKAVFVGERNDAVGDACKIPVSVAGRTDSVRAQLSGR